MKHFTVALVFMGMLASAVPAGAAEPLLIDTSGRPLRDGDVIGALDYDDPDLFIIKIVPCDGGYGCPRFKRLFLNPAIFNMYGHLGGFARVRRVTPEVRDSFVTSLLFRNCETDDQKVWATELSGEDDGILHHVEVSGDQAAAEDRQFFNKVFCINTNEERFYPKSIIPYRRLADVPVYRRIQNCVPLPACARPDANPRCTVRPAPGTVFCPYPSGNCDPLPTCALPDANPACSLTATSPAGRPWCPPPAAGRPRIASLTPISGPHGTVVTIRGSGFSPSRNYVLFGQGELGMYPSSESGTTITFTVPTSMGGRCTGVDVRACPADLITIGPGTYYVAVESVQSSELRRSNELPFTVRLGSCFVGGCSGQLCTDSPDVASTCEWRPEYACYRGARCGRQGDGSCGWAMTSTLRTCLANPPAY